MNNIDDAVDFYISIGKYGDVESIDAIEILKSKKSMPFSVYNDWSIMDKLNITDCVYLVKGLTIAEKHYKSEMSNSVSAVIWSWNYLARQDREAALSIVKWIHDNTDNFYVKDQIPKIAGVSSGSF